VIAVNDTGAIEVVASVGVAGSGMNGSSRDDGDDHRALSAYERDHKREKQRVEGAWENHRDLYSDEVDSCRDLGVLPDPKRISCVRTWEATRHSLPIFTAYMQTPNTGGIAGVGTSRVGRLRCTLSSLRRC
jgi:hypothetical protein